MIAFNAATASEPYRGWFVGGFMPDGDPRNTSAVEIKYGRHKKGEARKEWTLHRRHALSILVSGKFAARVLDKENSATTERILEREGDCALWLPGEYHTWEALEDTLIISILW